MLYKAAITNPKALLQYLKDSIQDLTWIHFAALLDLVSFPDGTSNPVRADELVMTLMKRGKKGLSVSEQAELMVYLRETVGMECPFPKEMVLYTPGGGELNMEKREDAERPLG